MIRVEASEIRRLSKALKSDVGPEAHKAMNKRIRSVAEPIADDVRRAALGLPAGATIERLRRTKKSGAMSLRRGLAKAVEVRVGTSAGKSLVRIRVSQTKFEAATDKKAKVQGGLPRYVENPSGKARWRHPLYGNRNHWYQQPSRPFLLPTVMRHKDKVRDEIVDAYMDSLDVVIRRHGIKTSNY